MVLVAAYSTILAYIDTLYTTVLVLRVLTMETAMPLVAKYWLLFLTKLVETSPDVYDYWEYIYVAFSGVRHIWYLLPAHIEFSLWGCRQVLFIMWPSYHTLHVTFQSILETLLFGYTCSSLAQSQKRISTLATLLICDASTQLWFSLLVLPMCPPMTWVVYGCPWACKLFASTYVHQLKEYHMLTKCGSRGFAKPVSVGHQHEGCIMYVCIRRRFMHVCGNRM